MPRSAATGGRGGRKPKAAAAAGYQHSAALTEGTILTDVFKKEWRIHKPIGQGGFGVIYLASKNDSSNKDPEFVVKMEPKGNGPLFCECTFYQRAAKTDHIKQWLSATKKKTVGMPQFIAIGFKELQGVENRFMIMERFGTDLQKLFVENGKRFPRKTVQQVAIRMIDTLEYIHSKDYIHADIKAANVLLGYKNPNQVFLVDFGLAARYKQSNGSHNEYKEDPRKAHDGTIEFTSRDAHKGVASSRRSDFEILGYCLLQWLCGELPWENNLANKNYVRDQKFKYMDDIPALMKKCFKGADYPREIEAYLEYVANLEYTETPDYKKMCQIFLSTMKAQGFKDDKLDFTSGATAASRQVLSPKRKSMNGDIPAASPKKRARKSQLKVAAESQCPTPVKRVSSAKATPKRTSRVKVKVESPLSSPELGTPFSILRGKRKSDTPPEPPVSPKQRKRSSATPRRTPLKSSSRGDTRSSSNELMMNTKPTMRKRKMGPQSVASTGTQTTPSLKGLDRKRRT